MEHIRRVKGKAWRVLHDIRRLVGEQWGATLPVVIKLYLALVRPILEYACPVWDCARMDTKAQLESVHRAALLAATGAQHTTSTKALEVYTGVESLQDRRDLITVKTVERVKRLDQSHEIHNQYSQWSRRDIPVTGLSVFPRALSLRSVFCRYARCSLGDDTFAEPLSRSGSEQVQKAKLVMLPNKQLAKERHIVFCKRLKRQVDTLRVYTDGSAIPNPGKIGLGVTLVAPGLFRTLQEPVGIGSNLTAELCGIRRALGEILSLVRRYSLGCLCSATVLPQ